MQLLGQRAQLGTAGSATITVKNAGSATLSVSGTSLLSGSSGISCEIADDTLAAGAETTLTITYDGVAMGVSDHCSIFSNDPDEPELRVQIYAKLPGIVDPSELAPDFSGMLRTRNYESGSWTSEPFALESTGMPSVFLIWGSWCPACLHPFVSSVADIRDELPAGVHFFIVNEEEPPATMQHTLEKVYMPAPILSDYREQSIGASLYRQPGVGLPFGRAFVIDAQQTALSVHTGYGPAGIVASAQAAAAQ